jgi:1-acyl-sn-glycerol-3-phosphate acyltransferase
VSSGLQPLEVDAIVPDRLPRERGRLDPGPVYWILRFAIRAIIEAILLGHLKVEGKDRVPKTGGLLVISNHIASADPPILGCVFPRPLHFMAKVEWYRHRPLAWLARQFLCFPVVRHTPDRGALRYTLDLLEKGHAVAIYPEGTRTPDARLRRPEGGIGFIARRSGAPIVPVGIWGSEKVLPRGRWIPYPARTHMVYGSPFHLPDPEMSHQEAADYMMSRVAELLPPAYRGYFNQSQEAGGGS